MKVIRQTSLVLSILFFLSLRAYGAGKTATGFYWPTGTDGYYKGYASFLGNGCSPHRGSYDFYIAEKYHLGEDIAGNFDDPVYAIADGIVVDKDTGSSWGESSQGLFVRSRLHTGEEFVWLMGHITSSLQKNDRVTAGQVIGKIAIKNNPHAHLGVLNGTVIPLSAWGAMPCSNWSPDKSVPTTTNGFVDPIGWITTQIPSFSATWHPNGTLIRAAGDDKVYYLKRDGTTGKLKRRHIVSETVFTNSGYNWNEVVVVSPQERDCFDEGAKVTAPESDLLKARLVIPEGDYKVYAISENQLRWLNLTPEEFVSVGYQWGNVGTLHANHNIPYGTVLTMGDFKACERTKPGINLIPTGDIPPPTCTYAISPLGKWFKGEGGEETIEVTTQRDCAWNIQYRPSWFEVQAGLSGTGSGTVSYRIGKNPSAAQRGDIVTLKGLNFLIDQDGNPTPSPPPPAKKANGAQCVDRSECSSDWCTPIPDGEKFCLDERKSCSIPGGDGIAIDQTAVFGGTTYRCKAGNIYIPLTVASPPLLLYGVATPTPKSCQSTYAAKGPDGRLYCVHVSSHCGQPDTEGIRVNESYPFQGHSFTCVAPDVLKPEKPLLYGETTPNPESCQSGQIALGPENKLYCVHVSSHCGQPGTEGVRQGAEYWYNNRLYRCDAPDVTKDITP